MELLPYAYLDEPWKSEIPSPKGIGYTCLKDDSYAARMIGFDRYKDQAKIEFLWCIKHEWGVKISALRQKKFKKFEAAGLFLQARLRLCIEIHAYFPCEYRNAAHWFSEILREIDQVNAEHIFNQNKKTRGNKKASILDHRTNLDSLKCGENPYSPQDQPNLKQLIDFAIKFGHKDEYFRIKSIADAFGELIKAYSHFITERDRSADHVDFFISENDALVYQSGKGNMKKSFSPKVVEQLKSFQKKVDFETHTL